MSLRHLTSLTCPACRERLEYAPIFSDGAGSGPADVTTCHRCLAVLVFAGGGRGAVRLPTAGELFEIAMDDGLSALIDAQLRRRGRP